MLGKFQRQLRTYLNGMMEWAEATGMVCRDRARVTIKRGLRQLLQWSLACGFSFANFFTVVCVDNLGHHKWTAIATNSVTNAGLNSVLNVYLNAATQITVWYIGLVDVTGFTAFASSDTAASHAGWTEVTAYAAATRPAWTGTSSTAQSTSNSSTVNFAINATKQVKGIFFISENTKSGSTGTLFSTAAFTAGNQSVASGDTLQVTYTVSAATT